MYRTRGLGADSFVWVALTLEPGQRIARFSGTTMEGSHPREVFLGIPATAGRPSTVEIETLEHLRPERGRYRVETLNVFLPGDLSAVLQRRTVVARIESSRPVKVVYSSTHAVSVARKGLFTSELLLDASGFRAAGPFRFFYSLDDDEPESASGLAAGLRNTHRSPWGGRDEFLEPRRHRPRRRPSLRRLP